MSKALNELRNLLLEESRAKKPNMPDHYRYLDTFDKRKAEKREKKRIEKFLELKGHYASIIENRGQRIDKREVVYDFNGNARMIGAVEWIGSGMKKGIADIKAVINGKAIDIELKRIYTKGKDRQSDHQKIEQEKITKAGGLYIIVNSFDDFFEWYNNNIHKL